MMFKNLSNLVPTYCGWMAALSGIVLVSGTGCGGSGSSSSTTASTSACSSSVTTPCVNIKTTATTRTVNSNGIPDESVYTSFPDSGDPGKATAQAWNFTMAIAPTSNATLTNYYATTGGPWIWGVALNGVPLDPGTGAYYNMDPTSGWNVEATSSLTSTKDFGIDTEGGHPDAQGEYHYHQTPAKLIASLGDNTKKMVLVGYAADGYPVYATNCYTNPTDTSSGLTAMSSSWRIKSGNRPTGTNSPGGVYDGTYVQDYEYVAGLGTLDEANGRTGVTPEYPKGTYYYVLTATFPEIPRYWAGTPNSSFDKAAKPKSSAGSVQAKHL